MSKTDKDELIQGVVQRMPFSRPPRKAMVPDMASFKEKLEYYVRNCPYVFRIEGLSSPVGLQSNSVVARMMIYQELVRKAIIFANQFLKEKPELEGKHLTLIQGTTYDASQDSKEYCWDILSVSIIWRYSGPNYLIRIGKQCFRHTVATWANLEPGSDFVVAIKYSEFYDDETLKREITEALANSGLNINQEMAHGQVLDKAIEDITRLNVEYPVAAASLINDEIWWVDRPYRHHHIYNSVEYIKPKSHVDGFLTNHGNFVTRYRAMWMAAISNQVIESATTLLKTQAAQDKAYDPVYEHASGLRQEIDGPGLLYRIGATPLFSEDLF